MNGEGHSKLCKHSVCVCVFVCVCVCVCLFVLWLNCLVTKLVIKHLSLPHVRQSYVTELFILCCYSSREAVQVLHQQYHYCSITLLVKFYISNIITVQVLHQKYHYCLSITTALSLLVEYYISNIIIVQ